MTLQELIRKLQAFMDFGVPPDMPITITFEEVGYDQNIHHNIDYVCAVIGEKDSIRIVC